MPRQAGSTNPTRAALVVAYDVLVTRLGSSGCSLTATLSEGGRTGDPSAITSLTAMADGGGTSSGGVVLFLFAPLAIGLVALRFCARTDRL